jgi:UDPglucose 6-dehydrogenase
MKNSKLKIALIGYGFVGKKIYNFFKDYFKDEINSHIVVYDPFISDGDFGSCDKDDVNSADLAIVCVPTKRNEDGKADISIVEEVIKWIETPLILIKSTVPPGTTDMLAKKYNKRIAFSPEFVGESTYYHPFWDKMIEEPAIIIGSKDKKTSEDILDFFQPILGPTKTFAITNTKTAELTKYMENVFFATKVIFANEMKKIADAFGVSYYQLRELWALDPRVNKMHTSVFKGKLGFGGKCFPKDLSALIEASKEAGYKPEFLEEVQKSNARFRKENN